MQAENGEEAYTGLLTRTGGGLILKYYGARRRGKERRVERRRKERTKRRATMASL